jgi:hypothetical protein
MRNHMAVTIEGWKDSVKGKGRLRSVGFEYNKLNTNTELLTFYGQYLIDIQDQNYYISKMNKPGLINQDLQSI